ncbi:DUF222 domain-containing protein [Pseudolysinimonas sp.]|jgi:hypothetical protein|uniref:HNH endonuclease signature motif containing protein n=1 Tax=Pseudolysinimonas sp. TaxID=2680009 RepID=UPI003783C6E4
MTFSTDSLSALADVSVPFAPPVLSGLPDDDLMDVSRLAAEIRRRADAVAVVAAAELKRRSRPELGHSGLAQKLGVRTPEKLVQRLTGVTKREAGELIRVGEITAAPTPSSSPDLPSWLGSVGAAVRSGSLTVTAADAIRSGLGVPCEGVPAEALARAASALVQLAPTVTVEQLAIHARALRDDLDESGIADRAARLREKRYLHLTPLSDGMTRINGLLDPESAAIVTAAYDGATSPRRHGVRFVDPQISARADELLADPRTTEQIGLDAFVELIRVGAAVDPGSILPFRRPDVVVHVDLADLDRRAGRARIEGQHASFGIATAERHICESGVVPILFDGDRRIVEVGVPQRLFTRRQRIALAARDGGCTFPHGDRPPSWTEAHHLKPWSEGGATSVDNGILLCRHHHLLVHDHGWRIHRRDGEWEFEPPRTVAPV